MKWLLAALVAVVLLMGVAVFFSAASLLSVIRKPAVDRTETWRAQRAELESQFDGFLVWESRRGDRWQLHRYGAVWNPLSWRWVKDSDRWRLWICELDGSEPRPLTGPDPERDHFAPHISPDGKCVVYLSYPAGKDGYMPPADDWTAELRLLHLASGRDELLVPAARTFGEHRSAMWIDVAQLVYMAGDGETRIIDLKTGSTSPLLEWDARAAGMDFEYGWLPNPSLEYATTGRPRFAEILEGSKATRPRTAVRNGCQPYFTADNIWGYFMEWASGPRISRVHLATRNVTPLTSVKDDRMPPEKNYIYFPMISRSQEVMAFAASSGGHDHFREDYDIFLVTLNPADLQWQSIPVRYTFHPQTDRYPDVFVERIGDAPAVDPEPEIFITRDADGVVVLGATIALDAASLKVNAEFPVSALGVELRRDGRELRFILESPEDAEGIVQVDVNAVSGLSLPTREIRLSQREWPISTDSLVFHWRRLGVEPQDFMDRAGAALWDRDGAMQLRGGTFTAGAEGLPLNTLPLALEFAVRGFESFTSSAQTIFMLGNQVRLFQEGRTAKLQIRENPAIPLFDVDPRQPDHVLLQLDQDSLKVFLNGEIHEVHTLPDWPLQNRSMWTFGGGWHGSIEQVALYQGLLTTDEISLAAARLQETLDPRIVTARSVVQARLKERSPTPLLESIAPYRDALASFEAEVIEQLEGNNMPSGTLFRLLAPVILNAEATVPGGLQAGDSVRLLLEPLEINQQTEEIFVSDELEFAPALREYFSLYELLDDAESSR